jgi:tRNA(Ile)-lysidine synthase
VIAATVDHGLRREAAEEAAMVARLCAELDIGHETHAVTVAPGNLQGRAREARYAALCRSFAKRGCEVFATAHHADDQAETVLMRLNRGSGLAGLAGIRARRLVVSEDPLGEYLVVRPLLHWRRAELAQIVSEAGIEPASDPSNDDVAFDRVKVRGALAALSWLDPLSVARSADLLQEAEDAVEDAVSAVRSRVVWDGEVAWYRWGHARLIEIEVVASILAEIGANVRRSEVAQMIERLQTEGHATLGGVVARRAMHRKDPLTEVDSWRFEREPPRRT